MVPSLPALLWRDWQTAWSVDVLATLVACAYLIGVRRVARWPAWRTAGFLGGVACIVFALQSGVGAFDDRLLSVHMVQHLLLLEVGPLLLLAGRPAMLIVRSAPRAGRPAIARRLQAIAPLTRPLVCLAVFYAVVLGTHIPAFYDATLGDNALHEFEHALYLTAGLFMWWPMVDGDPVAAHRLNGLGRLAYVIAAMLPMTFIGAYLYRDVTLLYPAYAAPARALGVSAIADEHLAGSVMWVVGSFLMAMAGLWQVMVALVAEERRMQVRERAAASAAATGERMGGR
ncbi:MAG TPA: cytochrome c oxidase assembly protein [Solirubrobacteraceae bacterium]|jgi:putative copper resistance protein D|nr:cytochrome c oxidase assembly protein [Solirubrobacteraceae bacterium]